MDLTLNHHGTFHLANFRTTNKVEDEEEILTAYLKLEGPVPKEMYLTLTGATLKAYEKTFWTDDGQQLNPTVGPTPHRLQALGHIVVLKSGIGYTDEDATIRAFKLMPIYGHQFKMSFEILVHPKTDAPTGRMAAREHHDIEIEINGKRQVDLVTGLDEE